MKASRPILAEYALLTSEGERLALEFRRAPFDVEALIAVYRASGRPRRHGDRSGSWQVLHNH
jgi:hypothetical protein